MKTNRLLIAGLILSVWAGLPSARAQPFQYQFIPSSSNLYPLSSYQGSYVDVEADAGSNIDYATAFTEFMFVTAQGTLNSANSHIAFEFGGPPAGITWNFDLNQITFESGAEYYPWGQAAPIVVPGTDYLNISYFNGNNFESDTV